MTWDFQHLPVTRVEVELTEACNLACRFCYNSCAPNINNHTILILKRLNEAGVLEIILTGGEPRLHNNFVEILEYACKLFPRVMVQSNGTLFATEKSFKPFIENRIFCLNFSLHGPQKVHDALTRKLGAFEATYFALKLASKYKIRTASNCVLTSYNVDRSILEDTVDILKECGCKEMTVTRFIPTGRGKGQPIEISADSFFEALRCLSKKIAKNNMSLLLANSLPFCETPEDLRFLCNRCSFGFDKFYIDVNGNVLLCGMSRINIGNILQKPLFEILDSSSIYTMYRRMEHIPSKCSKCQYIEFCGGGCRAAALAYSGVLNGFDKLI